ncbi:MBL fold metallo-hydrolase [Paenibacillus jiagnxiensis]|uniref:MBL fold metallo-hydrolase n=1 Tax=Paenibacillus jiagnxiensis TaxID=3228926 RepID=UPI0033B05F59
MADSLIFDGLTATEEAAPDILKLRTLFVNTVFIGEPGRRGWVLVDTGMPGFQDSIISAAEARYPGPPSAIILTHGHFDHVGTVIGLIQHWGSPVYAHPLELPFLTGREDYLLADPSVGGGLLAGISFLYPNEAIDLDDRIEPLPADGTVPGAPEWKWLHTPGHTPGHVSLIRQADRMLISGDAIISVKQESALAVVQQESEIHGPPAYFTTDWHAAKRSVELLAEHRPAAAVTGHGPVMKGAELERQLQQLTERFEEMAVPKEGKYV